MAGDIKQKFGTSNQTLTITLASLANNSLRESTYVDNTSDLFADVLVLVQAKTGGSGTSSVGYMNIYAYGYVGGSVYSAGATGADAAFTENDNLVLIGRISMVANSTTYYSPILSVAAAFGGVLPSRWGIIIKNVTGATISSTGSDHVVRWQGIYAQYT